jgi:hypothetical protein
MGAAAQQCCPLCRGDLCMADAVRKHLIADHKRSAAEADALIARFDIAKPITAPEPEPHLYCATEAHRSGGGRSRDGAAAAPEMLVD